MALLGHHCILLTSSNRTTHYVTFASVAEPELVFLIVEIIVSRRESFKIQTIAQHGCSARLRNVRIGIQVKNNQVIGDSDKQLAANYLRCR